MKKFIFVVFSVLYATCSFAGTKDINEVKATIEALDIAANKGNYFTVYCESLPPTHQKGFYDMVQTFATCMDASVWNSFTSVFKLTGKILMTKSDFIIGTPRLQEMKEQYLFAEIITAENCVAVGEVISAGASISMEDLKNQPTPMALAKFLDSKIGALPLTPKKDPYIGMPNENGSVYVCYNHTSSSCPNCIEYKKVDGKWIPEEIANINFDEKIAKIKEEIDFTTEDGKKLKKEAPVIAFAINMFLQPILLAKTQEEFNEIEQTLHAILELF